MAGAKTGRHVWTTLSLRPAVQQLPVPILGYMTYTVFFGLEE